MLDFNKNITLAHGAGGKQTAELIQGLFSNHFKNDYFTSDDAAVLPVGREKIAFTTDGFIVSPWKFPGGNIGKLSICGTVNDLACMGAQPKYLSCAVQIEEGFPLKDLQEIVQSMAKTAAEVGVKIVVGDTKVAGRGQVDKIFITTTGIGTLVTGAHTGGNRAAAGDAIIVTGDVGRHGCTILVSRDDFNIEADITSDCAPLWNMVDSVFNSLANKDDLHVVRDATRGGVGTVLYEIAEQSQVGIKLDYSRIPVNPAVKGVCGMLGLEPLYLACEGRLVIFAPQAVAPTIVNTLQQTKYGKDAAIIGEVTDDASYTGKVVMTTEIGTLSVLPSPSGELLPRIC